MKNLCSTNVSQSTPYSLREKGFTLIEILIALAIMSIVTTAIYQLFINQQKTWLSQDLVTEMQQNSRVSIDAISRDLLMAGYGVTTAIETDAGGSDDDQIAIRYKDPNDGNNIKRIMYWRDATENILYRKEDTASPNAESSLDSGSPGRVWGGGQPLADNVTALTFTYFNQNGDVLAMPPSAVYRVKVSLKVRTSRKDPITLDWKYLTLSTDIRPRNIGIGGVAADTTPPEIPDPAPTLTDPHICGELNASWIAVANAAGDLAGYVIYIGPAAGTYTQKVSVGNVTSYTLTGLDNAAPYYIAIASRDKSGNESDYSAAATTTPVADEPGQPVGLDATASSTDPPSVTLTWTSNATNYPTSAQHVTGYGPDTDVGKYHVYRKTYGASDAFWAKIGETDGTITTYSNALSEAEKCATFEYKIKAINKCDTTKESSFSASVYGDGAKSAFVDSPVDGTSDTTASDGTKPAKPVITASKAGYRRDYLNWNNPSDSDLDAIVIRYSKTCGIVPLLPAPLDHLSGTAVEEYPPDGLIPGEPPSATGRTFTHNGTLTGTPNLGEGCTDNIATYAYSLFAVDKCRNYSDKDDAAVTTVAQCGEATPSDTERKICQEGAPTWSSSCNPVTESGFTVSNSCGDNYTFTWNRIDDSPDKIWDMAGYYIYRRLDTSAWTPSGADSKYTGLILNSTNPSWSDLHSAQGTDNDSSYVGNAYQYYVIPIDCNRETNLSANPWATFAASPTPPPTASEVITVKPGRVTFANNTSVTTGYLTTASPFAVPNYYHNTVDVQLKNTSAASVKLKSMRASWINTSAYLKTIYKKNADGTWTAVWTAASPVASGTTVTFSTALGVQGVGDLVNNPWTLRFLFSASDGTVTQSQDMREDTVTVTNIEYDKIFTRDATEITPSCTYTTPETVSVPLGPVVSNTSQQRTSSDIVTSSTSASYWTVSTGMKINVFTRIADSSGAGISSVKLYYKVTDRTVTDYSTILNYSDISSWTLLTMRNIGGTEYALKHPTTGDGDMIPAQTDKRIWYFILVTDNKGNFDMEPERGGGAFVYDQPPFDKCSVTPLAPSLEVWQGWGSSTTTAAIMWKKVDKYTNGGDIDKSVDPITYQVWRRNSAAGSFVKLYDVEGNDIERCSWTSRGDVDGAGPATASDDEYCSSTEKYYWKDTIDTTTNDLTYYVIAKNSCSATGNVSSQSNTWRECVGAGTSLLTVSPTTLSTGSSYTVTVSECGLATDATLNSITVGNIASTGGINYPVTLTETNATSGLFTGSVSTTKDIGEAASKVYVSAGDLAPDTITVSCSIGCSGAPPPATVTVNAAPCDYAPATPAAFALNQGTNKNATTVTLNWAASTIPDVIGYNAYSKTSTDPDTAWVQVCTPRTKATTSCTAGTSDGGQLKAAVYMWRLTAIDSCTPTALESAPTSALSESLN